MAIDVSGAPATAEAAPPAERPRDPRADVQEPGALDVERRDGRHEPVGLWLRVNGIAVDLRPFD